MNMIINHTLPLGSLKILLHWLVALLMIGLTLLGYLMVKFEVWDLYSLHKSMGVIALLIVVPRIIIRLGNRGIVSVRQYSRNEVLAAKMIHLGLLVSTLVIPVSGMLYSGAAGRGVAILGLSIIPMNLDGNDPANVVPYSEALRSAAHAIHIYMPYIMLAFLLIHIVGAVKHHLLDKDGTLLRMLGRQ
ncbi:cytochrome b [Aeromonas hydrophila]|uniref:cytochrome b n=1 Tax=Aeromonas hydrophila TaxID=644 RepID=UPI001F610587|nr:cytochrome b [Aeromonas hydrophila]